MEKEKSNSAKSIEGGAKKTLVTLPKGPFKLGDLTPEQREVYNEMAKKMAKEMPIIY